MDISLDGSSKSESERTLGVSQIQEWFFFKSILLFVVPLYVILEFGYLTHIRLGEMILEPFLVDFLKAS